jgi:hypothetical protein
MGSVGFDVLPQSRQGAKDRKDFVWFFAIAKKKNKKRCVSENHGIPVNPKVIEDLKELGIRFGTDFG